LEKGPDDEGLMLLEANKTKGYERNTAYSSAKSTKKIEFFKNGNGPAKF
jgi:hypothetical protein